MVKFFMSMPGKTHKSEPEKLKKLEEAINNLENIVKEISESANDQTITNASNNTLNALERLNDSVHWYYNIPNFNEGVFFTSIFVGLLILIVYQLKYLFFLK